MDGVASGASVFSSESFAAPAAAQNVEVRLYLSDGRSIRMEQVSGAGYEYTAEIEYLEGTAIYIEALVDNIVLKNFFDSVKIKDGSVSLGETTPFTTLFVDILEEIGSRKIKDSFEDSTFTRFDVNTTEVRADIVDDITKYTTLKNSYSTELTWDKTTQDVSAELVNSVQEYAKQEGFDFGKGGNLSEQQEAKAFADEVMSRYFKGTAASLIYSDGFLNGGQTAEEFIANMLEDTASTEVELIDNNNIVEKVSDGLYNFYINQIIHMKENKVVVQAKGDNDYAAQIVSGMLKKINGKWYFIGDQEKAWYSQERTDNELRVYIDEHNSYPIVSATISSSFLNAPVNLTKHDKRWDIEIRSNDSRLLNNDFDGKTLNLTINYADGTTKIKSFVIPAWTNKTIKINSAVKNGNGTVTVNYSIPSEGTYHANIIVNNFRQKYILWGDNKTIILPADVFVPGQNNIGLIYHDVYRRQYSSSIQITY